MLVRIMFEITTRTERKVYNIWNCDMIKKITVRDTINMVNITIIVVVISVYVWYSQLI